ncbi:hypothetical protein J7L68_00260 [bacterium]|nr:hypothetical protein [bacterium]
MKIRIVIGIIFLIFSFVFATNVISPIGKTKTVNLDVDGKKYTYWICEPGESLYYDIIGSGSVKIYLRTESGATANVKISLDGRKIKTVNVDKQISKKAQTKTMKNITKAKKITVKIPRKKHRLTISTDKKILLRTVKSKNIKYYSYVPQKHSGGMVLVSRETEYGYYKSIESHPVQCEIIGDGTITVYSRFLYSNGMMGNQHYSVSVSIDAGRPTIYEFETRQSSTAFFRTDNDIIPSKAGKIKIVIPEGNHKVTISPTNSNQIAVRILIPSSMLKRK